VVTADGGDIASIRAYAPAKLHHQCQPDF